MPNYHRVLEKGGTYFFTLVTFQRQGIFTSPEARLQFHQSINHVKTFHPFTLEAYCILPDHVHFIWHLPEEDVDYSMRIGLIKAHFSKRYNLTRTSNVQRDPSRERRREATIWQRRFWEHLIRDEDDLQRHIEYIHYNPVKHGLVERVTDWPDSSFMDYVQAGFYSEDWGGGYRSKENKSNYGE